MNKQMEQSNTFKVIIDRFEANFAVCEVIFENARTEIPEIKMQDIELSAIPFEVKERDILLVRCHDDKKIEVISKVPRSTKKRRLSPRLIRFV